jgi:hypothetical protein
MHVMTLNVCVNSWFIILLLDLHCQLFEGYLIHTTFRNLAVPNLQAVDWYYAVFPVSLLLAIKLL